MREQATNWLHLRVAQTGASRSTESVFYCELCLCYNMYCYIVYTVHTETGPAFRQTRALPRSARVQYTLDYIGKFVAPCRRGMAGRWRLDWRAPLSRWPGTLAVSENGDLSEET